MGKKAGGEKAGDGSGSGSAYYASSKRRPTRIEVTNAIKKASVIPLTFNALSKNSDTELWYEAEKKVGGESVGCGSGSAYYASSKRRRTRIEVTNAISSSVEQKSKNASVLPLAFNTLSKNSDTELWYEAEKKAGGESVGCGSGSAYYASSKRRRTRIEVTNAISSSVEMNSKKGLRSSPGFQNPIQELRH